MNVISTEVINLLKFIIPGLITSKLLEALLPTKEKKEYILIIESFIYTILIGIFVSIFSNITLYLGKFFSLGEWNKDFEFILSIILAVLYALVTAYLLNNDIIFACLREKSITRETSYIEGWYGAFSQHDAYVVLHLKDGRRLMGRPTEWPTNMDSGVFQLINIDWLTDDEKVIESPGVDTIIVRAESVDYVEFLKNNKEEKDGKDGKEKCAFARKTKPTNRK